MGPMRAVAHLLADPALTGDASLTQLDCEWEDDGARGELATGSWFRDTLRALRRECPVCVRDCSHRGGSADPPCDACAVACSHRFLLPVMLYLDGTVVSNKGNKSLKPVVVTTNVFKSTITNQVGSVSCGGRIICVHLD